MPKLGQHFLVDKKILNKIIKAADLQKSDIVLEIGPGKGVLTREIAKRVKKVIAVELDKSLAKSLKVLKTKIINKNILDLKSKNFNKIIGNIPYYITGKILRKFAGFFMVLMLQKEVAQRICSKKNSLLSLSVNAYSVPKIISFVPKSAFSPQPKIDSAIIKIIPRKKAFKIDFDLAKRAFAQKRKKLKNTIGINSDLRPEDLSLEQWITLSTKTKKYAII